MNDLLKTEYTIITSDGQYIVESYNGYPSIHSMQCPRYTFTDLLFAELALTDLKSTNEFDWLELYIIRIDKKMV